MPGGEKPFPYNYMTFSGHMEYNFTGNAMSIKHQAEVAELDRARSRRLPRLQQGAGPALAHTLRSWKGGGRRTRDLLSGDHYPYA
jgi:hypothetical protein